MLSDALRCKSGKGRSNKHGGRTHQTYPHCALCFLLDHRLVIHRSCRTPAQYFFGSRDAAKAMYSCTCRFALSALLSCLLYASNAAIRNTITNDIKNIPHKHIVINQHPFLAITLINGADSLEES